MIDGGPVGAAIVPIIAAGMLPQEVVEVAGEVGPPRCLPADPFEGPVSVVANSDSDATGVLVNVGPAYGAVLEVREVEDCGDAVE